MSHTKGPWEVGNDMERSKRNVHINGQTIIASANFNEHLLGRDVQEANARLIAAAPELLEACRRYMRQQQRSCEDCRKDEDGVCGPCTSEDYRILEDIQSAIAKAEGRQP